MLTSVCLHRCRYVSAQKQRVNLAGCCTLTDSIVRPSFLGEVWKKVELELTSTFNSDEKKGLNTIFPHLTVSKGPMQGINLNHELYISAHYGSLP
ncbi:hypothetical protein ACFXTN_026241 [Malus domestica]